MGISTAVGSNSTVHDHNTHANNYIAAAAYHGNYATINLYGQLYQVTDHLWPRSLSVVVWHRVSSTND